MKEASHLYYAGFVKSITGLKWKRLPVSTCSLAESLLPLIRPLARRKEQWLIFPYAYLPLAQVPVTGS